MREDNIQDQRDCHKACAQRRWITNYRISERKKREMGKILIKYISKGNEELRIVDRKDGNKWCG